jgi:hypothetical protein
MTSVFRGLCFAVGLSLCVSTVGGCGESEFDQVPVYPVRGVLLVDGKPAAGTMLTLHPSQGAANTSLRSMAVVENDGSYAFTTYLKGDGAPEGEFVLTAYWPDARKAPKDPDGESEQLPPDLLRGRFSNPSRSPLRVRVAAAPNELAPVDLNDRTIGAEHFLPNQTP